MTTMNRRVFATLAAVALTEMGLTRDIRATERCTTGNCSGNQVCSDGYTCTPTGNGNSKECRYDGPEPVPCDELGHGCDEGCVCLDGACYRVTTANNVTVYTLVTVTAPAGGKHKKRKHRKHRKHRAHSQGSVWKG